MKEFGIGKKMMIGGALLVCVPLVLISIMGLSQTTKKLRSLSEEQVMSVADRSAEMCSLVLKEELKIVRALAANKSVRAFILRDEKPSPEDVQEMNKVLASERKALGEDYSSLFVMDTEANVLADSKDGGLSTLKVKDRQYFRKAMKGEVNVGEVVKSRASGKPVLGVGAPILDDSGTIRGVAVITLTIDFFTDTLNSTKLGTTGYVAMIGNDGLVVAHPNPDNILELNLNDVGRGQMDEVLDLIANGKRGMAAYTFDGESKISGVAPVGIADWSITAIMDQEEFLAPVRAIRNGIITMGAIFLVITVGLVILWSRTLSRPIVLMAEGAQLLAQGDINLSGLDNDRVANTSQRKDEIGRIGRAFSELKGYLKEKADVASRIAGGDLDCDVSIASKQDSLGLSFQTMIENLNGIMSQVGEAAMQVENGTSQVSDSSQALSQGATEQAASLEEITSSVTQLASQTKTNAENAAQANQLSVSAREKAVNGNEQIREMTAAMAGISDSSKEIAKIIKTIDDIAFQTNLLALNAAVEAARAGKHGKGFAVVAQEVRNLAGRSAKAAQETAEMIEGALKTISNGSEIVDKTADALEEIVGGATKVADLVGEIASASNEQAQGISQINQGLSQVEQVTQQNTASAEETASAAEELSGQAVNLRQLVSFFNLVKRKTQKVRQPQKTETPKTHQIAHEGWGGKTREPAAAKKEQKIDPEQIISLDEDDFGKY